jgi:hypothetical protein
MRERMMYNRDRVIGTFSERVKATEAAERVLLKMEHSGHFTGIDLDSFRTTILAFLREPVGNLMGMCSYSRNHRRAKNPGERTWRILLDRNLLYRNDGELEATIYHEFLHGILGPKEGHGAMFQQYEQLWPQINGVDV